MIGADPKVLAVVLHFNRSDLTIACVDSLLAQSHRLDIVIVDNGSTDDSRSRLAGRYGPAVRIRSLETNRGIPGGLNAGLRSSLDEGYDATLIALNDTVLFPDGVARLVACLRTDPGLGAVAPIQVRYDEPRVVVTAGGTLDRSRWSVAHRYQGAALDSVPARLLPAEWLDFSCILIATAALRRVGLLEERYRFYWDDVDWGVRSSRAGFRMAVDPGVVVRHRVGGTMGSRSYAVSYHIMRNRLFSRRLLYGRLSLTALLLRELAAVLVPRKDRAGARTRRQAFVDFLLRRPYPPL